MKKIGPYKSLTYVIIAFIGFLANPSMAGTCTGPVGNEAGIVYNGDNHTYQFCNGTNWLPFSGGSSCGAISETYTPVAPSGSGYFVVTSSTFNGNFGGTIQTADSDCLTDLTTNTGWMGYSTANSNGQLTATKVHAFFCDGTVCTKLMPLTTYYFANSGNGSAGGASFTTDSNGNGPGNTTAWSGATYFGASYTYWTNRAVGGSSAWGTTPNCTGGNPSCNCNAWTNSTAGDSGTQGISTASTTGRWNNSTTTCNTALPLVCFVDP